MVPEEVREYLDSHRDEHLGRLFELLCIPGIANNDDGECERAAQWILEHAKALGLNGEIIATGGRPAVLASLEVSESAPTVLIYGHYDVQPPDPLDQWESGPFTPQVRDGWVYARGVDDDKGQLFAHLMAIEAYLRTAGKLPVNVKLLIEGEEEIGSPNLEALIAAHADELSADAVVISDSAFFADGAPSIIYSLRGLACVELVLRGPNRDLHSGVYGGAVANPANALAKMVARMQDDDGRVTLPGFYDDVLAISDVERESLAQLGFDEAATAADVGAGKLTGGEANLSALERLWARPTLDCNGIVGGYTLKGSKTIIPAQASAKISMRLVPNQDPETIAAGFGQFVDEHTPPGIEAEVIINAAARPVMLSKDSPAVTAAAEALREVFGSQVTFIRCGASVPVTDLFQRICGLDAVMMGFGLPEDRPHSPNERLRLDQFFGGSLAAAAFMQNLADSAD